MSTTNLSEYLAFVTDFVNSKIVVNCDGLVFDKSECLDLLNIYPEVHPIISYLSRECGLIEGNKSGQLRYLEHYDRVVRGLFKQVINVLDSYLVFSNKVIKLLLIEAHKDKAIKQDKEV